MSKHKLEDDKIDDDKKKIKTDDNLFEFNNLLKKIREKSSHKDKSLIINEKFNNNFNGDILLWLNLLLPNINKRIFNLHDKQLIKIFNKIFENNKDDMIHHFENGNIGQTIISFFKNPAKNSTLTLFEVDNFLNKLSTLKKEEEQIIHFKNIIPYCTKDDLEIIINLIKHDLKINAGAKFILNGLYKDGYKLYQHSHDLLNVINR